MRLLVTNGLRAPLPVVTDTFERALLAELESIDDLTAIVGEAIYPQVIPQEHDPAEPAITYKVISKPRDRTLDGPTGTARGRVQLNCCSQFYETAKSMAAAIRIRFDPLDGTFEGRLAGSVEALEVWIDGEHDLYEKPKDASDSGRHIVALDLICRHVEPQS